MGPVALAHVLRPLDQVFDSHAFPDLLVGLQMSDDAAVYRLNDEQAIIQTTDFFPPVVDDPYQFGAIAAANAMSDVYAMGGQVLLALNLAGFPEDMPPHIIQDVFRGGAEKVAEAGGVIGGGHTIMDEEPKYGLAVTGLVHPQRVITKAGARPGDLLLLTKPLGTGILTTALRNGAVRAAHIDAAVESMLALNRPVATAMQQVDVHAATDVTGFGLLGHGLELSQRSSVGLRIRVRDLPILEGTREYARAGHITGGASRNAAFVASHIRGYDGLDEITRQILLDPQTSGGLLIAVPQERAAALIDALQVQGVRTWCIGEVIEGEGIEIVSHT